MAGKSEYRSSIRSKKLIRQAFVELLQEKKYENITVTDVVKRADINRGTFYAHYPDIRGITEQIVNEIMENVRGIMNEFHYQRFFDSPMPLLNGISNWLLSDLDFYRSLIQNEAAELFLVKLQDVFVDHLRTFSDIPQAVKDTLQFSIHVHFVVGAIINVYRVWLRGDINIPIENVSSEIGRIFMNLLPLNSINPKSI
ncbi:TetR/AcrR family transcriptional regulator [Paenibacillus sp. HN-1]|uniref:TetR/AcrR family transcriptional regulator n=1 Tax=Paenibacillus TaxID=44249 RepID=UPI001CA7D6D8|nr:MULTISPECIES: TetR/AcrR family transcriptional regulator [Paenibacillus]MBY9080712.1 TetR/AcrR family transcriptional regulator [Paenibacillus sp. CGMCC 1.18879]MBY9086532.1 TetR/AcrR family transcriptional regulator [Paenibacillus sinensis]